MLVAFSNYYWGQTLVFNHSDDFFSQMYELLTVYVFFSFGKGHPFKNQVLKACKILNYFQMAFDCTENFNIHFCSKF